MKKKFRILLTLVMSLTMIFGMSTTAYAGYTTGGYYYPDEVNACDDGLSSEGLYYVSAIDGDVLTIYFYSDGTLKYNTVWPQNWKPQNRFPDGNPIIGRVYYGLGNGYYYLDTAHNPDPYLPPPSSPKLDGETTAPSSHTHDFRWQTITEPTKDSDGLEGEVCSCGAMRNTQLLSAYGYALNEYAAPMINATKPGQTITFEFGEWNSFPKSFMAKLVDKSAQNVTFVFKYKWNHETQTITIPAGTPIDLNSDWYGPAKMAELYGNN